MPNTAPSRGRQRSERFEDELLELTKVAPIYRTLESVEAGPREDEQRVVYLLLCSYIVRRAICALTAKNLNAVFQRIAARFRRDGTSLDAFVDSFADQSGPAVRFPSDDEPRTAMVQAPTYKTFVKGERLRDVPQELEGASRSRCPRARRPREARARRRSGASS